MIKEIVKPINDYLATTEEHIEVKKSFNEMIETIKLLQDDKKVPEKDLHSIIKDLRYTLKREMDNICNIPLSKKYIAFIIAFAKLSYNFNKNSVDDPDVDLFCKFINKTMELIEFSRIVIEIEKVANIRIQEWKQFNPPAFSVSNALLEEVLEDE